MKRYTIILLAAVLWTLQAQAKELVIGVVPQQSPFKLLKVWQPVAEYLSQTTGHTIVFKTEKSIPEFERVLYNGGYDIAYMNPYHYVIAAEKEGYSAAVRADKKIVGILVSDQPTLQAALESTSKRFLFPSPNAFAATLLTKYELKKKMQFDIDKQGSVRYVNSHDSVYKGVARGIGDIGGGIERTYRSLQDETSKAKLHIVYRTDPYPSHPIAFKPSVDPMVRQKIVQALMNMPEAILQPLKIKTFIQISDAEYDSIRELAAVLNAAKGE